MTEPLVKEKDNECSGETPKESDFPPSACRKGERESLHRQGVDDEEKNKKHHEEDGPGFGSGVHGLVWKERCQA